MKEVYEFRLFESEAKKYFRADEGTVISSLARVIHVGAQDPLFSRIRLVELNLRSEKRHLVASWACVRKYTKGELEASTWFTAFAPRVFEPVGEECGTVYDEKTACMHCGFGATQMTPLALNLTRVPKGVDVARTLAGELVASERFASLVSETGASGADLRAISHAGRRSVPSSEWWQLVPNCTGVEVAPETRFGIDPFTSNAMGEYKCPIGHVLGLRRLSELTVLQSSLTEVDLQATRGAVGIRAGVLRPERILVLSKRLRDAFTQRGLKGLDFEVVRVARG